MPTPMDMEWAKDVSGQLFILQARPETVQARRLQQTIEIFRLGRSVKQLITGRSVGSKIAQGRVRVVNNLAEISDLQTGEVLVTDKTDPDWEPIMKKASAIVTNRGGRTCHAAIVSRELGLAAVVGTEHATEILKTGQEVTVSCAEGDTGIVYDGLLPFGVQTTELQNLVRPRTKIMLNVGNPDDAFALSALPNDGVGLARIEFIISHSVKIHPQALLDYDRLEEGPLKQQIAALNPGYADKSQFFVDRLAEGVAMIAGAFYPKDVIVRMSDFKSNEYAGLLGGDRYEPKEENPMIGFRGASRYYNERFRGAFGLECQAMKKVRNDMGLNNVKLMIPFCRTVHEGELVQQEMARHGLRRGQDGLELYVMCEIPSNVICAEEFGAIFDGFSIGSNDLTQLLLGVDRDSEIVAGIFDERDPAVKRMIADVIKRCRAMGRKIGICGQAPSDYPDFAEFLVKQGIDSISLNPDTVLQTTAHIVEIEKSLPRV